MKWKRVAAVCGSMMMVLQSLSGAVITASADEHTVMEYETEIESESELLSELEFEMESELADEEPESESEEKEVSEPETEPESKSETEGITESEAEEQTENTTILETEVMTEKITEADVPSETEQSTEAAPETEEQTETGGSIEDPETETDQTENLPETEKETEKTTEKDAEADGQIDATPSGMSGQYHGSSYWDSSWYIDPDFRFTQVEKVSALTESARNQVNVYDTSSKAGNVVGILPYFSLAYVLETGDGWSYIESGDVRGFVENKELKTGDYVDTVINAVGEYALAKGESLVSPYENHAFTYTHTTTKEVIAEKQYGITIYSCDIKEYPTDNSRAIGEAHSGNLVFILEIDESGWYFVESGNVRGFIDPSLVMSGNVASDFLDKAVQGEALVDELVKPSENESLYYTLKSVKVAGSGVGNDIAETALGFVGKLGYVWGGTSLLSGADCSGFVQSVFGNYGITLPRLAEDQGVNGIEIESLDAAKPGDVIYWACGPHVGIYVGNGLVVQCSGDSYNSALNPGKGPTLSFANYMPITSIRRYLIEEEKIVGESGNRLDLTAYSTEQIELIWAIVAQEDNGSYEGALAVISSAMNRSESAKWAYCGNNALAQLTAGGQYCYSLDTYWQSRLHGNVPEYVKQAVNDCLKKGIRNHDHTSFRSTKGKTTGNDAVQIGGNWYFGA